MSKEMRMNPYEGLANAVILQAVKDYRSAARKLSRGRKNYDAEAKKADCLRFFHSGMFSIFTDIDPKFLIRKLDEEAGDHDC